MTVLITLTAAGTDSGPFNLYSNLDGYITAFETGVSKASLLGGYTSVVVPDYTTSIRVKSTGDCVNYIDIVLVGLTTTTTTTVAPTTTTTTTAEPTTTTTTTETPTTTTTTTAAPISQDILLGYSGADSATSCTNIATPVTKYIPYGQDWMVVTFLYENASPDTTPAIPGYYSDGAKWYFWDGATFSSTGFC